jgi:23S rRNA (uracil1939-C5)-methyltransferase
VLNQEDGTGTRPLCEELSRRLGPRLHSLWLNFQPKPSNTILGPTSEHVSGPPMVSEVIADTRLYFGPGAFGQSNLGCYDSLVRTIGEWVRDGEAILELYAGVGGIGLSLVERSRRMVFNELGEGSLASLHQALSAVSPELRDRCEVREGSASGLAAELSSYTLVIADPPRRGLDAEVLSGLLQAGPERFIYVSCGADSFLRDAEALVEQGTYRLTKMALFDMFPHGPHVETLARFERSPRAATAR